MLLCTMVGMIGDVEAQPLPELDLISEMSKHVELLAAEVTRISCGGARVTRSGQITQLTWP